MIPNTLFVFVDGFGIGVEYPEINPLWQGGYPALQSIVKQSAWPINALLDMPGLPQSATGQASIITGINAAKLLGRHQEGFPGPRLAELVDRENIFKTLVQRGYSGTFANAYYIKRLADLVQRRRKSVSTVATLSAFGTVRLPADLLAGRAVYQDITRAHLRELGHDVPLVTPEEAARHLMDLADEHAFTLFEYFQTDLMAHKGGPEEIAQVLTLLDRFMSALLVYSEKPGRLLIFTSDHGNIEEGNHRNHTHNPVPFLALGHRAEHFRSRVTRLEDITPAILDLYPSKE